MNGWWIHEKILITISHQQSGNQNPRRVKVKKCLWRGAVTGIYIHCCRDCKINRLLWKGSVVPQNVKHSYSMIQQVHSHYISLYGVLTKTYTWMFTAALFIIVTTEITSMSNKWWMDKQNAIIHKMKYYLAMKKWYPDTYYNSNDLENMLSRS